jgi:hypothetical protein
MKLPRGASRLTVWGAFNAAYTMFLDSSNHVIRRQNAIITIDFIICLLTLVAKVRASTTTFASSVKNKKESVSTMTACHPKTGVESTPEVWRVSIISPTMGNLQHNTGKIFDAEFKPYT